MADRNLQVRVGVNLGDSNSQLKALNTNLKNTQSAFKLAGAGIENFGKTQAGMKSKSEMLTKSLEDLNKKSDILKNKMKTAESTLESTTKAFRKQEEEVKSLRQQLQDYKNVYGENSEAVRRLGSQLEEAERQLGSMERAVISSDNQLTNLSTQLNNVEADVASTTRELERTNNALAGGAWTEAGAKIQQAGKNISAFGKNVTSAGKSLLPLSVALGGIGGKALSTATEFQYGMSQVKAISRSSAEDMALLEAKAREMGKATSFSAYEASEGLQYMALAGFSTTEMLSGLEPILRLAEAGNIDLGLASDLVTDSMGALGKEVSEMPEYLDKVALASNISNQSIEQMLNAMINIGGSAQTLGIGVSELGASMGVLADNGTKGELAGTKLNSILTRMTAQSKIAKGAWDGIGVSVFDANGKFRGLTTVLSETREKMAGMTEEQQQYFLKQTVGADNINDFKFLLEGTTGKLQEYTGKLDESSGALNTMASTMKDNLQGRIEGMQSAFSEACIVLGNQLIPIAEKVVAKFTEWSNWFASLNPQTQEMIVKIGLVVAGLAPLLIILGSVIGAIGSIVTGIGGLVSGIGWLISAFSSGGVALTFFAGIGAKLATVFGVLKAGAIAVGTFIAGISAPVWITIGAITALVAGGIALWKNWDWVCEKAKEVGAWIGEAWSNTCEAVSNAWNGLKEGASNIWNGITDSVKNAWNGTKEAVTNKANDIKEGLSTAWENTKTATAEKWNGIKEGVSNKMKEMLDFCGIDIQAIGQTVSEGWTAVKEGTSQIWGNISGAVSETWSTVSTGVSEWTSSVGTSVSEGWEAIKTSTSEKWGNITGAMSEGWGSITGSLGGWLGGIKEDVSGAWSWIKDTAIGAKNQGIQQLIDGDWEGFKTTIGTAVSGIKDKVGETWEGITTKTSECFGGIGTAIGETWGTITGSIGEWTSGIATTVSTKWSEISTSTSEIWGGVTTSLGTTWETLKTSCGEKFENMRATVSEKTDTLKTNLETAWDTTKENVKTKVDELKESAKNKFEEMKNNIKQKADETKNNTVNNWNEMTTNVSNKAEEMKNNATNKANELKTNTVNKFNEMKTDATNKFNEMKTNVSNKANEIRTSVSEKFETARKITSTIWNGVKGDIQEVWNGLVTKAGSWCTDIKEKIKTGLSNVGDFITAPFKKAKETVGGILDKLNPFSSASYEVGVAPVPDFNSGIAMASETSGFANMARSGSVYNANSRMSDDITQIVRAKNGMSQQSNVEVQLDTQNLGNIVAQAIQQALAGNLNIEVNTNLDGRQVAKATAKYMDNEINTLNKRRTRLGGNF